MRRCTLLILILGIPLTSIGQIDKAQRANELWHSEKRLEALPLYEELVKEFPKGWLYEERLADCYFAKTAQATDPAEIKELRVKTRNAAKKAIELGDTRVVAQSMANIDPDAKDTPAPEGSGAAFLKQAEKAFTAGDLQGAMALYGKAADADPKLYEAPLFAGDVAMRLKDLKTATKWFVQAIAIDPDRETAHRYWGDALMRLGGDPFVAREKFIDALVAEPYSKYAWQGIRQWAETEKAVILAPKIDRPGGPLVDAKKPNNINITIDAGSIDDKKHPGSSAWMMYSLVRAGYRGDSFKKDFPDEKVYRHTLKEEDSALTLVATSVEEKKINPKKLDESLRNLVELNHAGMLDCWILISGADNGVAQDYNTYRKEHRQLLHDYLSKYVVHGGVNPSP